MSPWLSANSAEPVAQLVRDGRVESIHHGVVAVVDASGKKLFSAGEPKAVVYPRSTLKPLQTVAVLGTGVELTDLEVALTSASHNGSARHQDAVRNFLLRHQLSPGLLQCPADWPLDRSERLAMMAAGDEPNQLAMNCSGKHSGFLAACQHQGWDLDTYLLPTHPLQRTIVDTIESYAKEKPADVSIDGCGAPLFGLSVLGLAKAIASLVTDTSDHATRVVRAINAHPWAIAGEGHANTTVIERLGGIAKIGAEGLVVIALPSGVAVAVKILDGSMRATTPVALAALKKAGALEAGVADALTEQMTEKVFGGSDLLGRLETVLD